MIPNLIDLVFKILEEDGVKPYALVILSLLLFFVVSYLGVKSYSNFIYKKSKVKKTELSLLHKLINIEDEIIKEFSKISILEDVFYKYTHIRANVENIVVYMKFYNEMGGTFSLIDMKEIRSFLKVYNEKVYIYYNLWDRVLGIIMSCMMFLSYFILVFVFVLFIVLNIFAVDGLDFKTVMFLLTTILSFFVITSIFMVLVNPIKRAVYFKKILEEKRNGKSEMANVKKKEKTSV